MAAPTFNKFPNFLLGQMTGSNVINFASDSIKVALFSTLPASTATYLSDLTGEVASGGGYTTGGNALTGATCTLVGGQVVFTAASTTWSNNASGFANAAYAVIYKSTGTGSTSRLVAYIDLGGAKTNVGGDLVLSWSGSGIIVWQ